MKIIYSGFRIMLMTFTFGLASFWLYDGITNGVIDKPVNLPASKSDEIFVVLPTNNIEIPERSYCATGGRKLVPTIKSVKRQKTKGKEWTKLS